MFKEFPVSRASPVAQGIAGPRNPQFRGAVPGSLEAAALETISVKLHDQICPISVADTFDPHLRTVDSRLVRPKIQKS